MANLILNGSTSGSVTLSSPAVSGTTTLTLPATSGTIALTADPTFTGQATIPTINLTGGQITFPATQSASADANTLDDYEEGTWTPSISSASGWASGSPSSVTANYTKIGNVVRLYATFILSSSTGNVTANDRFTMTGAPFTAANNAFGILNGSPDITVPITWLGNSLISSTTIYGVCLIATGSPARNTAILINLVYRV
jgi:hypothetical protein